jgi:hypothetical protein
VDDLREPLGFAESDSPEANGADGDVDGHSETRPNGPPDPNSSPERP